MFPACKRTRLLGIDLVAGMFALRRGHRYTMNAFLNTMSDTAVAAALDHRVGKQHLDPHTFIRYRFPTLRNRRLHRHEIKPKPARHIRIVVVADTHMRHRTLEIPECDLLVHCGDIMMTGRRLSRKYQISMLEDFNDWLGTTPARERIVIGGNHDHVLTKLTMEQKYDLFSNGKYMENEEMVFEGVRIWATPLSQGASDNKAFQTAEFTQQSLEVCPPATDILITHSYCPHLTDRVEHSLHLYGHVHWQHGLFLEEVHNPVPNQENVAKRVAICAPICDGSYNLTQWPVIVDYPCRTISEEASQT